MRFTKTRLAGLSAVLLLVSFRAHAAARCPDDEEFRRADRLEIQRDVDRALEGYRNHDVKSVVAARGDIECRIPVLREGLGPGDVARIHLAYAVAASASLESDEIVSRYLVAARASVVYSDEELAQLVGEGDRILGLYHAAGSALETNYATTGPARVLPPPWNATLRVNGREDRYAKGGPYYVEVIGVGDKAVASYYHEYIPGDVTPDVDRIPPYPRLRPVQGALAGGATALTAVALGLGLHYADRANNSAIAYLPNDTLDGDDVNQSVETWKATREEDVTASRAFLVTAGACGLAAIGFGVWWGSTF